jgi:class 3 adenylate cyclase
VRESRWCGPRTLITTYLGSDAAERVLAGNIVRGRAQAIRAVVWFSDLIGFTRLSDTVSPDVLLALLNDYAEAQVEEIEAQGGHVLKFMGDGILAIFPDETTRACKCALDAAANVRRRIAALNERRQAAGLPVTDTHLALHVGELLYGNLGSPRRLDFTVLGSAVKSTARARRRIGRGGRGLFAAQLLFSESTWGSSSPRARRPSCPSRYQPPSSCDSAPRHRCERLRPPA